MDIINSILLLVITIDLILASLLYFKGRRNVINLSYASVIIAVILWTLAMIFYRLSNQAEALFWCKILYIAATFTSSTFLLFTFFFPKGELRTSKLSVALIFLGNMLIIFLVAMPNIIIRDVILRPNQEKFILFGPYYFLYMFYILSYFFMGFWAIAKEYSRSFGISKIQIQYVFFGYFISANGAFITNLIMPWAGDTRLNWLGQIITLFWTILTTYAIFKHHLMNIKIIATELLTSAIVLILAVQVLVSKNLNELILRLALLIIFSIFGILLIRSVTEEVRRREEMQRLTKELEIANKRLKELDKIKNDFISIASHQLRTPLTIIKGLSSMLLEGFWGKHKPKEKKQLEKIYISSQQLIQLIDDLLDISRIESGRKIFKFELIDLEKIIESVIKELKDSAKKKNLYLRFEKPDKALPKIKADALKIRQIIINFIDNAIHYTDRGGITLKLEKKGKEILFSVTDTGIGFNQSQKLNLFQKFSRGKDTFEKHTKGAGLGLYVAAKIIEAHQGKIGAESPGKNKGSVFWFTLPIK